MSSFATARSPVSCRCDCYYWAGDQTGYCVCANGLEATKQLYLHRVFGCPGNFDQHRPEVAGVDQNLSQCCFWGHGISP